MTIEERLQEAERQLAGCLEDNKRKTYAVQRSQIENESLKDRIRQLEKRLAEVNPIKGEVFIGGLTVG